jgi:hypothetical protein
MPDKMGRHVTYLEEAEKYKYIYMHIKQQDAQNSCD